MKHCFLELLQFDYSTAQKAQNEFTGPGDTLKNIFLDYTQVALYALQDAENEVEGLLKH